MARKSRYISLSDSERLALETGHKMGSSHTFRQRCHYILLNASKHSASEISDIYQVSRQTVTSWFRRYKAKGIKGLETSKGRGPRFIIRIDNEFEMKVVEELVAEFPQNLHQVLEGIESKLGKKMSKDTLKRLLKKRLYLETSKESKS